ncbi:MAG: hypothetical protein QXT06_05525 [Candidatus Bathyarchaeia archaeon]
MRVSSIKFIIIIVMGIILGSINTVYADYEYALTIEPSQIVPPGTLVTVTARTNDTRVTHVIFHWYNPDEVEVFSEAKDVSNGIAMSKYTPGTFGEWRVVAVFHGVYFEYEVPVVICVVRMTSLNVVPEVPVVGVAGTLAAMLISLHLYMKKMIKLG